MSILLICLMQFCLGEEQIIRPENLDEMDTDVSGVIMADDYKLSLGYLKEFEGVRKWNKNNGIKAVNADEFLSGIKKDDRFDVVSNIYRNNIDYIYSKYDGTRVDKDLLWMIGKITENQDIIELSEIKEGESVDMCEAWKKFYEGARQEGIKIGNRTATIDSIIFMIRYGIPKKDLLTKFTEEEYNEALSKMKAM